jgi:hypothetical protein
MDNASLILGELREFKRATLERLDKLEKNVDSFKAFRAKIVGAAMAAQVVLFGFAEGIKHFFL